MLKYKILNKLLKSMKAGTNNWLSEYIRVPDVKVIVLPVSKVTQIYILKHRLQSTRPVEAKLWVDLLWVVRMKVCLNGPGHVTEMADMPIYDKNPF